MGKFWAKSPDFSKILLNLSQFWLKFGKNFKKINPFIHFCIPNFEFYNRGHSYTKRLILLPMLAAHHLCRVFWTEYPPGFCVRQCAFVGYYVLMWIQQSHIYILFGLHQMSFCAQISFIFRCPLSFIKMEYFDFRLEANLELCALTSIFQTKRKTKSFQNISYDLLLSHDDFDILGLKK